MAMPLRRDRKAYKRFAQVVGYIGIPQQAEDALRGCIRICQNPNRWSGMLTWPAGVSQGWCDPAGPVGFWMARAPRLAGVGRLRKAPLAPPPVHTRSRGPLPIFPHFFLEEFYDR